MTAEQSNPKAESLRSDLGTGLYARRGSPAGRRYSKLGVVVDPSTRASFDRLAGELGISKSALADLALVEGMKVVRRKAGLG